MGTKTWRSGPPSGSPGSEVLHQLYVVEDLTLQEIGTRYGVSKKTAHRWVSAAAIPRRDSSASTKKAWVGREPSDRQREAGKKNAATARLGITEESRAKQAAAMKGRTPPNKGGTWTPEARAKHMAYRTTDEYRKAASERQKGEKGNNWRGGQTDAETRRMQGWAWRQRRKECYERDNWTCQDCGVKCTSRGPTRIQAHHVIRRRDGGLDDLTNLVTLCLSCHHKREHRHSGALFA